jgi:hypothetical protein
MAGRANAPPAFLLLHGAVADGWEIFEIIFSKGEEADKIASDSHRPVTRKIAS